MATRKLTHVRLGSQVKRESGPLGPPKKGGPLGSTNCLLVPITATYPPKKSRVRKENLRSKDIHEVLDFVEERVRKIKIGFTVNRARYLTRMLVVFVDCIRNFCTLAEEGLDKWNAERARRVFRDLLYEYGVHPETKGSVSILVLYASQVHDLTEKILKTPTRYRQMLISGKGD